MTLEKKTEHISEALAHFISQFKAKANLSKMSTTYLQQIQELEDVFWELLLDRGLETAVGVQLDGLGRIVGIYREGREDEAFRIIIRARILTLQSSGTPEEIYEIMSLVIGLDDLWIREYWPAAFTLELQDPIPIPPGPPPSISLEEQYARILRTLKPAGVKVHFLYHLSPNPFRFDSGPGFDQGRWGGAI